HVGPLASFVLWDTMARILAAEADPAEVSVLLAGGIHDGRSAAMALAAAAPLTDRGARVGVLAGTAYLFTAEAVASGAVSAAFQEAARAGAGTVLRESGPGHAPGALPSPFAAEFAAEAHRLHETGVPAGERRARLERLNLGRLRLATKGLERVEGGELT